MKTSDFYSGGRFDPRIPTPEAFLGHAIGDRLTPSAGIERYMTALAEESNRVRLRPYGTSVEGRRLYCLIITAPENHRRIETIRASVRRLADPRKIRNDAEAETLARTTPAITYLAHNVHGGEHSTGESAMVTAYLLTAGGDRTVRRILDETVVIVDPVQNPDGRDRSINYFYSAFGVRPNPDPGAAEHQEPWASGRGNHYLFDLNRDWFPVTQPETAGRIEVYLHFLPQVYADLHEMGHEQTYFFPPPAPPSNPNFSPLTEKGWRVYGDAVAGALDRAGVPYFTGEIFDAFYPGYGESWPIFHGGVGMTFEQASARGLGIRRMDGTILTFREAIRHHVIAAMATCRATAERRQERLRDFYLFHRTAVEEGQNGPVKEVLIPPGDGPLDARRLARLLVRQGVEVRVARRAFRARCRSYRDEAVANRRLPAGTCIVRLDQPRKRLICGILEKETRIDPAFVKEEIQRRKDRLPSRIYDVTAWSLPLACGVETFWSEAFSAARTSAFDPSPRRRQPPRPARAAYLLPYTSNAALASLVQLLSDDRCVRVARKPFRMGGESFGRGTVVLRQDENGEDLRRRLTDLGATHGVTFAPVDTSRAEEGIDLGSASVVHVKKPKVAMLYDVPTSSLSYGWSACLFEGRYRLPFTAVRWGVLASGDLRDYNVIVLPDGPKREYQRYLGDDFAKRIRGWIAAGGTLVAIKGAAAFLAESANGLTGARLVTDLRDLQKKEQDDASEEKGEEKKKGNGKKDVPEEFKPDRVPGAILRVRLDQNHFLTYGYGDGLDAMVTSDLIFTPTQKGRVVGTFEEPSKLRVAGFVWEKMLNALPGQAYAWDDPSERGHVICFADDPAFRGYWEGLHRLYFNAILFGPSLAR